MSLLENMGNLMTRQGMMNDDLMATSLLNDMKTGIKNIAVSLTEASTPEVRSALQRQLNTAIEMHEKVYRYMVEKGLYHADNLDKQIQIDMRNLETAMGNEKEGDIVTG